MTRACRVYSIPVEEVTAAIGAGELPQPCAKCNGTGVWAVARQFLGNVSMEGSFPCPARHGDGEITTTGRLANALAHELYCARLAAGWQVADVASALGVPAVMLANAERALVNPSPFCRAWNHLVEARLWIKRARSYGSLMEGRVGVPK